MYSAGSVYLLCMTWHRICAYTSTNVLFSLAWLTLGWKASSFSRFCIYYSNWQLFHQPPQTAPPLFCSSSSVCYLMAIQQHVGSEWNASHAQEQWKQREDEYVVKMFSHKKNWKTHDFSPDCFLPFLKSDTSSPTRFPGLNPPVLVAIMLMFSISAWTWKHRRWDGVLFQVTSSDHFLGGSMMV